MESKRSYIEHMNTSDIQTTENLRKKDWVKPNLVDINITLTMGGPSVDTSENLTSQPAAS